MAIYSTTYITCGMMFHRLTDLAPPLNDCAEVWASGATMSGVYSLVGEIVSPKQSVHCRKGWTLVGSRTANPDPVQALFSSHFFYVGPQN
jgi:hypothetical protein